MLLTENKSWVKNFSAFCILLHFGSSRPLTIQNIWVTNSINYFSVKINKKIHSLEIPHAFWVAKINGVYFCNNTLLLIIALLKFYHGEFLIDSPI